MWRPRALVSVMLACVSSTVPATGPALAAEPSPAHLVSVRIHDYDAVDHDQLDEVQRLVAEAYRRIGVDLRWLASVRPADAEAGRAVWPAEMSDLTVVILSGEMAAHVRVAADVVGYAPVSREVGGRIAFVFGQRARQVAAVGHADPTTVLAGVITHELAHLLMPTRSHSSGGVMQPRWRPSEFRQLARRGFSAGEAIAIRQTVGALQDASVRVGD